jgi:hypothetical protein
MQWFRMYAEAIDDEKLRLLGFDDRWFFVALLCLKAQGILDEKNEELRRRKISVKLGLDSVELETVVKRLVTVGLVSSDYQPLKWNKRQYVSDSSTKRVRAFRERNRNVSVTPSEADSESETESERTKKPDRRTARAVDSPPPGFVEVQREYPKRAGGQRWGDAQKFFKRRIAEGEQPETILAGVRRYAEFTRAVGIERTEKVQQAATFLGDNRGYLEQWHAPPRAKSAVEQAREDLRKPVNRHDESVVSEQTGSPTSSSDLGSFARLLRG